MGGLCADYVFLLQGSLSTCSRALPLCVCVCVFVHLYPSTPGAPLHTACLLNVTCCFSSQTGLFAAWRCAS